MGADTSREPIMTEAGQRPGGDVDVTIIGAGQSGLAVGYFLARMRKDVARGRRETAPSFRLLDEREAPGGAWPDGWDSLRLFSPASASSLPGWGMPAWPGAETPPASHVAEYLSDYERRYGLPVSRPEHVERIDQIADGFLVSTSSREFTSRIVVMASGTWGRPFVPTLPGAGDFAGQQLHASHYRNANDLRGQRVLVIGAGNSGAQIAADLATVTHATWVTRRPPRYLPDDVDGRALFRFATQQVEGTGEGVGSLGDVVVTRPVFAARAAGLLETRRLFTAMTRDGVIWADGRAEHVDAIIWCTGFRPDLRVISRLPITRQDGVPMTREELPTESVDVAGLFFVGYGDWCGAASATLIGVGAPARATAHRLAELLHGRAPM